MKFYLIAAADEKMGIGKNHKLPWNLPTDLKFFHDTTIGTGRNAVIMGRTTWESIPEKFRPLASRINIIMTRSGALELPHGAQPAASLEEALAKAQAQNPNEIFVIGGAQIFAEAISDLRCAGLYITEVSGDFKCDTFFPKIDPREFKEISRSEKYNENDISFCFLKYQKT